MLSTNLETILIQCKSLLNFKVKPEFDSHIPGGIFFTHSVRTPLTTLQLNLESIEKSIVKSPDSQVKNSLASAISASQQIQTLITNLPGLNKLDKTRTVNICQSLESLKTLYKNKDETYQLMFNIKLTNKDQCLRISKLHFMELMLCLIGNGFESYAAHNPNKIVIVTAVEKNKELEIQVQDFGKGLSVFIFKLWGEAGFSNKKSGKGFGLWFVRQVVEKFFHRKLKIMSEKEKGTIVRFSLPLI
jgi:K+-sensing histidine kinase KdpD